LYVTKAAGITGLAEASKRLTRYALTCSSAAWRISIKKKANKKQNKYLKKLNKLKYVTCKRNLLLAKVKYDRAIGAEIAVGALTYVLINTRNACAVIQTRSRQACVYFYRTVRSLKTRQAVTCVGVKRASAIGAVLARKRQTKTSRG
jgi:hypothetical protein